MAPSMDRSRDVLNWKSLFPFTHNVRKYLYLRTRLTRRISQETVLGIRHVRQDFFFIVLGVNARRPSMRPMNVHKQRPTCQLEILAITVNRVAGKRGVDVVQPFEVIEAWHERQSDLAMQKGLCDNADDKATTPARRESKWGSKASGLGRGRNLPVLACDNFTGR